MKFLIISSAPLVELNAQRYAYSPYVNEMNLWAKNVDEIAFACPIWKEDRQLLISKINFKIDAVFELKEFNVKSKKALFNALFSSIFNTIILLKAMIWADHIHLRCPGNISLLASFLQVFFPWKIKTGKYAGNWDPKANQPFSYRLQKKIISNTFWTKKCSVLVYGDWPGSSKNIVPFFTASYTEAEKEVIIPRPLNSSIGFVYTGMLSEGKNPMYAVRLVESLIKKGCPATLELYGTGPLLDTISAYISTKNLTESISLKGNKDKDIIKSVLKRNHFVILPSKSEGWPKSIAEGMFWGCVPLATPVSCLPYMLDFGTRGILLSKSLEKDTSAVLDLISNETLYTTMAQKAINWSSLYTLDHFENEIHKLIKP